MGISWSKVAVQLSLSTVRLLLIISSDSCWQWVLKLTLFSSTGLNRVILTTPPEIHILYWCLVNLQAVALGLAMEFTSFILICTHIFVYHSHLTFYKEYKFVETFVCTKSCEYIIYDTSGENPAYGRRRICQPMRIVAPIPKRSC